MQDKLAELKKAIKKMGSVVIGFSGGVDSTFLLKICFDVLGKENVIAVTADSPIRFTSSIKHTRDLTDLIGVKHLIINSNEMEDERFITNNNSRCYYCKYNLYSQLKQIAANYGFKSIVDGTNYEEIQQEDRPGLEALKELDIKMPLVEAKFNKNEIREISRQLGLPTWNQSSDTCLATRFSQQLTIDRGNLERIQSIEVYLKKYNFKKLRVRLHDKMTVRLEVLPADMIKVIKNRKDIYTIIKSYGITYVTLDVEGYRSGSTGEGVNYDE